MSGKVNTARRILFMGLTLYGMISLVASVLFYRLLKSLTIAFLPSIPEYQSVKSQGSWTALRSSLRMKTRRDY
jgi:hypothetical protein